MEHLSGECEVKPAAVSPATTPVQSAQPTASVGSSPPSVRIASTNSTATDTYTSPPPPQFSAKQKSTLISPVPPTTAQLAAPDMPSSNQVVTEIVDSVQDFDPFAEVSAGEAESKYVDSSLPTPKSDSNTESAEEQVHVKDISPEKRESMRSKRDKVFPDICFSLWLGHLEPMPFFYHHR